MNYILLFAFTLCETFILSVICAGYPSSVVLQAAGATTGVTVALTAYACMTKTDFTVCGGLMAILSIVLLTLILSMMFSLTQSGGILSFLPFSLSSMAFS